MGHYVSFIVHSRQDDADGSLHWHVRCVSDRDPSRVPDGSFVVRTWIDDEQTVRGLVRHVQSGQEMQFQSGKRALDFIRAWMDCDAEVDALASDWRSEIEPDERHQSDG